MSLIRFHRIEYVVAAAWISFVVAPTPSLSAATLQLDYSTYLGGSNTDEGFGVCLGTSGEAYITGQTLSENFPTQAPFQSHYIGTSYNTFVSKICASGSALIYSTYLGGNGSVNGFGISLGIAGEVYVVGDTASTNFPTLNAYQPSKSGIYDVFITKLGSSGSQLEYSSYLGGSQVDYCHAISVTSQGEACVTGYTGSNNFPTRNPYQASSGIEGSLDAYLCKLSSSGSALIYSTYLGGSNGDYGYGISVGSAGDAQAIGYTMSNNFPTLNPYQSSNSGFFDVFIVNCSSSGSALVYSTYFGGTDSEQGFGIIHGDLGEAYITGLTGSYRDFPIYNPYQISIGGAADAFISKLDSSGSILLYSTYFGGSGPDYGKAIRLGVDGETYIAGYTKSNNFPTLKPYQATFGGGTEDAFVSEISSSGSILVYSTYLGGSREDEGLAIGLGSDGAAYAVGFTCSDDFPTCNPYQAQYGGGERDVFISKLRLCASPSPSVSPTPSALPTRSSTPSPTPSATAKPTPTSTPFPPPSPSPSVIPVSSPTPQIPPTPTPSPAIAPSPTPTCGPSVPQYHAVIASSDFNGDGTSDIAIFRPTANLWSVRNVTRAYFGGTSDLPVPADFDGNGRAEIAVYRPSSGLWSVFNLTRVYFGLSTDLPVPGDYNGDGSDDIGIFRGSTSQWNIRDVTRVYMGAADDWPIPGDYTGDGTVRAGLFRPSSGVWVVQSLTRFYFGGANDWPVGGDWTGDGTWRMGLFRSCAGMWAIRDFSRVYFGNCFDYPRPADFDGDNNDDIAIFRPSTGQWRVLGVTSAYFGGTDDIPVTR